MPQLQELSWRQLLRAALVIPIAYELSGCDSEPSQQPDRRFITEAFWEQIPEGAPVVQTNNGFTVGTELALQKLNMKGIRSIDLTAAPYTGSDEDPTYSKKGGYPILALAHVKFEGSRLVLTKPTDRVAIQNFPDGLVIVRFSVPFDNPSATNVYQPPIYPGMVTTLMVDIHGIEQGLPVNQLNVANPVQFSRNPPKPTR